MKRFRLTHIYALALLVIAGACKKEEEVPRGEFAKGIIVVNEGNFGDSDGTISFIDPVTTSSTQDIYEKANGESISGLLQSVCFYEDKAYILDQVGNKIEVVDAETFKHIATINQGLSVPRYMTVANGKGYVSNWGPFDANWNTPDSYIAILDLTNFNVTNTINTDDGVEGMITVDSKVYAAASHSNAVHVIDSSTDEIVGGFVTPFGPKQLVTDANGKLWVLSTEYDATTYADTNILSQIDLNTSQVKKTIDLPSGAQRLVTNGDRSSLYLGFYSSVYKIGLDIDSFPLTPLFTTTSLYALGIDPTDETIYVGKSNGADNGTIIRYTSAGNEMDNFPSGRFPNGFVFRQ